MGSPGGMALRMLNGEKPQDVPIVRSATSYVFDWRALKRWGLEEKDLPPGSIVLNRQLTFWETYKLYIVGGFLLFLAQAVAILGLLWQRARRRKTEAELARSEEKFSKSFRRSPLAVTITSVNDSRYIEVNDTFERQTDWRRAEVIGRTPTDIAIWVDSNQRAAFAKQLLEDGHVRDQEIQFRTKGGQVRTGLASAESIEVNGERCALSVVADITERKAAEQAVASLSGRLIHSQEEERKRIARDLHDDYNQRLAVLAFDLEQLAHGNGDASVEVRDRLRKISDRVSELGSDLHSLSHSLHSSTLQTLGLVAGVRGFCREFTQQQGIQIEFGHKNVPREIPEDVSLCLFRVVQEALRNVKKHSGADRAEVQLESSEGKIHLSVSDQGRGLGPNQSTAECGIGLRSIEERLRVLGGHLEVHSRPMEGTIVDAWLPCPVDGQGAA